MELNLDDSFICIALFESQVHNLTINVVKAFTYFPVGYANLNSSRIFVVMCTLGYRQ